MVLILRFQRNPSSVHIPASKTNFCDSVALPSISAGAGAPRFASVFLGANVGSPYLHYKSLDFKDKVRKFSVT